MGYNNPAPTTNNAPLPLTVVRALVVSVVVAVGSTLIQLMLACLHSHSLNRLSYCRMLHPCTAMLIRALHCTFFLRIPCIPLPAATVPCRSSQQIALLVLMALLSNMRLCHSFQLPVTLYTFAPRCLLSRTYTARICLFACPYKLSA